MFVSNKSRFSLVIFSFFLGAFEIDRFYAGRFALGLLKLFTVSSFGLWWFIDFVLALTGRMRDENGLRISRW
ncbi:TM2 domain [Mycoplasmopsis citelli]|uniref:TM2 domain n=1 Tax=Mycoplasmopsis citelli TaxID=171281 RepID=A0A449B296_9BACT|nr:TM2 domain-containing protein [Mycoplasmopsis citelli]VEU74727.1 TM2 domain [Mycoplasmopsis citelli]